MIYFTEHCQLDDGSVFNFRIKEVCIPNKVWELGLDVYSN